MNLNHAIIFVVVGLLLVTSVTAYVCISPSTDNDDMINFKMKINELSLKQDREVNHLSDDAIRLKLKYFGPCR